MGVSGGSKSTGEGLVFYIDPANSRSYSGIGNTIYDLVNTSIGGTFINGALIDPTNNRSIYIDGVNDYVAFPVNTSLNFGTGDFTVNVWLKASSVTLYGTIFALDNTSQGNGILMYTEQTTGTLRTWCRGVTKVGTIRICTNAWTQVTLTRTSGTCRQYVNGVLDETYSSALAITSDHNLRIGYPYIDNYPFFGYFGQVQAYNRALPASEILNQYNRNIKKYVAIENSVNDGLTLSFDPANSRSYPGIGITINNLAGVGNTGILTNGPVFSALNGGSIYFDGSNDYIDTTNTTILSGSTFTVSYWIYVSAFGANYGSAAVSQKYTLFGAVASYLGYTNTFMTAIQSAASGNAEGVVTQSNFAKNRWYHYVSTYDGSGSTDSDKLKLYIDGVQRTLVYDNTVPSTPVLSAGATFALGYFVASGFNYFNGYLTSLNVYNRALSSAEVLQNYNATKNRYIKVLPPISDALVLNLDAGSRASYVGVGTSWYDLSGNNLNGTLVNGPTFAGTGVSSSIVFDRSNDYVSVADNSLLNTFSAMTLEIIVKYTTTNDQIFVQKWNYAGSQGYTIELYLNEIAAACYTGSNYLRVSVSSYPVNNVYHMILTLSGTTQTLYINGLSVSSNSSGAAPSLSGTALTIGNRSNLSGTYLGGNVYLTKFYNRALTAAEVLQNFNAYRTRYGI
jgi:hypothetical protein